MANETIEGSFKKYWENLVAKDSKLAAYPKSYREALRDAFTTGFLTGQSDASLAREVHRKMDAENRKN